MLRSREDAERVAEEVMRKARNETERKSKCYYIAQLFYKVGEYDKAVSYLKEYLSICSRLAAPHKLLGKCYEALNRIDEAIESYENSIAFDDSQHELLLKICELYNDTRSSIDKEAVKSILEKTQIFFPYHHSVVALKTKLTSDMKNKEEYEKTLVVEIRNRPADVKLRIEIINFYLTNNQLQQAYNMVSSFNSCDEFDKDLEWYECLDKVFTSYSKTKSIDSSFYVNWLSVINNIIYKSNFNRSSENIVRIQKFDKVLFDCFRKFKTDEFIKCVNHYAGELSYHMASFFIKKCLEDASPRSWNDKKGPIGALLMFSVKDCAFITPEVKDSGVLNRVYESQGRCVEVFYIFETLCKVYNENHKSLVDFIQFFIRGQFKEKIFGVFESVKGVKSNESFFMSSDFFDKLPLGFPQKNQIVKLYGGYERSRNCDLNSMIRLGLRSCTDLNDPFKIKIDPNFYLESFDCLNLSADNIENYSIESLDRLDMDTYLYLMILCKARNSKDLNLLPQSSTRLLDEDFFWRNARLLVSDLRKEKDSNWSKNVKGLEVGQNCRFQMKLILEQLRGNKLPLPLIYHLAKTFSNRITNDHKVEKACEKRAFYLWNLVLSYESIDNSSLTKTFPYDYSFTSVQTKQAVESARMYLGTYYMKMRMFDKALNHFKQVNSIEALYKIGSVYELDKSLADNTVKALKIYRKAVKMIQYSGDTVLTHLKESIQRRIAELESDNANIHYSGDADLTNVDTNSGHSLQMDTTQILDSIEFNAETSSPLRTHARSNIFVANGRSNASWQNDVPVHRSLFNAPDHTELLTAVIRDTILPKLQLLEDKIEGLESTLKSSLADLRKELKQRRADHHQRHVDEDDYGQEEVLSYSGTSAANYLQRNAAAAAMAASLMQPALPYFPPNLYQGSPAATLPFYPAPPPQQFGDPQMDYLRVLASQRNTAAAGVMSPAAGIMSPAAAVMTPPAAVMTPAAAVMSPAVSALSSVSLQQSLVNPPSPFLPQVQINVSGTNQPMKSNIQAPNNVVITTSDALPTSVPTTATPTLFVNIPPEHRLGTQQPATQMATSEGSTSAPHEFQIPMPSNFKLVGRAPVQEDEDIEATVESKDEPLPEHDPMPDFKPIIPMPDEVEVRTGEEDETVIFDRRAKLFRMDDKEWKERGLGQLKILKSKDETSVRYRILMRREKVHKICANHLIMEDMNLLRAAGSDKSYIWGANDYADEKVEKECFLVRFKTVEDGQAFQSAFEAAKKETQVGALKALSSKEQTKTNVLTPPKLSVGTATKDEKVTLGGFTFTGQPKLSDSKSKTEDTKKEEKKPVNPFVSFDFGSTAGGKETKPSFTFGSKSHQQDKGQPSQLANLLKEDKAKVESTTKDKTLPPLSSMFKPAQGSWCCEACLVNNKADTTICVACGSLKPGSVAPAKPASTPAAASFSFGIPSADQSDSKTTAGIFGSSKAQEAAGTGFTFGIEPKTVSKVDAGSIKPEEPSGSVFTFGVSNLSTAQTSTPPKFTFGSAKFNFTLNTPVKTEETAPGGTPKSNESTPRKFEGEDTDNERYDDDKDHTEGIYFAPVIEMPDKIEVKTGEEDETVLYSQRSKLFRFDSATKEWKERGVGDVKILKHNVTQKVRVVMRREPVMKLCLNHYLDPDTELKEKDPKSWMWFANDFSEGVQSLEKLCLRFKTQEIAETFAHAFDSIKRGLDYQAPDLTTDKGEAADSITPKQLFSPSQNQKSDDVIKADLSKSSDVSGDVVTLVKETEACSDELVKKTQGLQLPPNNIYSPSQDQKGGDVVKLDLSSGSYASDDEVVFVKETKACSDELVKKAQALQLPPNFFSYLDKKDCTGCRGCREESDSLTKSVTGSEQPASVQSTPQPLFFGSKSFSSLGGSSVQSSPGGLLSGQSVFGGDRKVDSDKFNTFSFALPPNTPKTETPFAPVFGSFQSPVFGSTQTSVFGSGTPTFGAGMPTFANQSLNFSKETVFTGSPVFQTPTRVVETGNLAPMLKDEGLTFGALVSKGADSKNTFAGDNSSFKWEGAGSTVFGASKPKEPEKPEAASEEAQEEDDETKESDEHDPHFEPIVPLPDKIELRTGEEDEDLVFCERAKLYKMDEKSKEWKERGVGQMKVLRHRVYNTHRLLMRREQIHKIVCNHLITTDINLTPHLNSETSYVWGAMNLSQDETEPSKELLCVRFKHKETATQFYNHVEAAKQNSLANKSNAK